MRSIRLDTVIAAPIGECFRLSLSVDVHAASMHASGEQAIGGVTSGVMKLGDQVTWRARHFGIVFHPNTLLARARLARFTGEAGDAAGAPDQYAALLPIIEQVLGTEHPDTLASRANLACWTQLAADAAGARDQYAALLPIMERVLDPEHPDTLTAWQELARLTGEAGDAAAARDLFAGLQPVLERAFGPDHPRTLTVRANLACTLSMDWGVVVAGAGRRRPHHQSRCMSRSGWSELSPTLIRPRRRRVRAGRSGRGC